MWLKRFYFLNLLFAALALAPAMAHLLELPNKINLSREDYLTVQQLTTPQFPVLTAVAMFLAFFVALSEELG
jgi:hypothetical protein